MIRSPKHDPSRNPIPAIVAIALGMAFGCAPGGSVAPPSPAAPPHAARAVLVSVDGMGGERLSRLMAEPGKLPAGGLRSLAETGFYAVRSVPSTPSLTPAAHATHVTGASPRDTGIVGNSLLDFSRPFGSRRTGFDTPLRADTLCEAAKRQGKRIGVMAYPHAAGTPPSGCASFGMNWVSGTVAPARLARLGAGEWEANARPIAEPRSFSPTRRVVVRFPPTAHTLDATAIDSTDDGRVNYDRLVVRPEVGPERTVRAGDWFPAEVRGAKGRAGSWCKLISLAPDLSTTVIYVGAISEADVYPDEFRRVVDARAGFWPGRADYRQFGPDSESADDYVAQSERLTRFLAEAAMAAAERSDWDLLFLYFSEVDAIEHHFLLVEPRQRGFTPERAARFASLIDGAFASADGVVARIRGALTPRDALFVTADHGMTPLRLEVYPDEILREAGFLTATGRESFDPSSAVVAPATSGLAHVYVNSSAPPGTLDRVERLLSDFRVAGQSPWDRIARRAAAGDLTLDAPESGDLILLSKPGIALSAHMDPGVTSGPAEEYGGHGYRAAYRELDATYLAAGPGVPRGRVEEISSMTIAARIAAALGIQPPRQAQRLPPAP